MPDATTGGRDGAAGEAQTGSTGSGSAGSGGSGTGSIGNSSSPFDPSQVYWAGKSRSLDEQNVVNTGFASVADPMTPIYGLSSKRGGRLLGDKFLYAEPGDIVRFTADSANERSPEADDIKLPTEPCPDKVSAFEPTPDGRLLYTCAADEDVWIEDGGVVHEGTFIALGNGGHILVNSTTWGELGSTVTTEIEGYPENLAMLAVRSHGDGFHAVYGLENGPDRELWSIENAVATKIGDYSPAEGFLDIKAQALAGDDTFYWFGATVDGLGGIMAGTVGGDSVFIHVDSEEAPIELSPHPTIYIPVVTGP